MNIMTLKEMNEQRQAAGAEIQKLAELGNEEGRAWTAEDESKWKLVNKDYDDLGRKIEHEQRLQEIDADRQAAIEAEAARHTAKTPGMQDFDGSAHVEREKPTETDRSMSLQGWMLRQIGKETTREHEHAARRCGIDMDSMSYDINLRYNYNDVRREFRASTTAGAGGETIPEGFVSNFERALLAFGGVRQVATVIRTPTGNDLPWPTSDDTSNTGRLLSEAGAVTETDMTTSALTLNAYKYSSDLVKVSAELIQDSAFNLADILGEMLGERIGRIENAHYTTGTGTAQPNGIVTAATLGKTAASATAITASEIIDLFHSVDPAYRSDAGWMMHDNIVADVRKLQDTTNQFLWQPGMQLGVPDRLFGHPVQVNQQMASAQATAAKIVLFGQMRKYIIRDVVGFRLRRLVERYADNDQEAFVAFHRTDGDLLDAGTNPVKYLRNL